MKKCLPIIIFCFTLILIVLFSLAPENFRNKVFSGLPFIKNFTKINYNSSIKLYNTDNSTLKIKTAQFDIDFLVDIQDKNKSYVALYPFTVVCSIDLDKIQQKLVDNNLTIVLPQPRIDSSITSNQSQVTIIRDNLELMSKDYDTYVNCIKIALEDFATDLAIKNGIIEQCLENAKKILTQKYFSPDNYKLVIETEPNKYNYINYSSKILNGSFSFPENSSFSTKKDAANLRDDFIIFHDDVPVLCFGANNKIDKSLNVSNFIQNITKNLKTDQLLMQISYPFENKNIKTLFLADKNGYNQCKIVSVFGEDYYLQNIIQNPIQSMENSAKLIYCGLNFNYFYDDDKLKSFEYKDYQRFVLYYQSALESLKQSHYAAVDSVLKLIQKNYSYDANIEKLNALNTLLFKNQLQLVSSEVKDFDIFNKKLKIAQVLLAKKIQNFEYEERQKLLSEFVTDEDVRLALKSSFLQNSDNLNIGQEEFEEYTEDIVQTGKVISKELFKVLPTKKMQEYLKNILINKLNIQDKKEYPKVISVDKTMYVLCDKSSYDFFTEKNHGHQWFNARLNKRGKEIKDLQSNQTNQNVNLLDDKVVLVYREEGFFVEYTALIFNEHSFNVFNNFSSIIVNNKGINVPYESIKFYHEQNQQIVQLGKFQYKNPIIMDVLVELQKAFEVENYYGQNLYQNLIFSLKEEVELQLSRP